MIPDAIKARAKADDVSFIDLWLTITGQVRDLLRDKGIPVLRLEDALEAATEVLGETDEDTRTSIAMTALTYGMSTGYWVWVFRDEEGNIVPSEKISEMRRSGDEAWMKHTYITWETKDA